MSILTACSAVSSVYRVRVASKEWGLCVMQHINQTTAFNRVQQGHARVYAWHLVEGRRLPRLRRAAAAAPAAAAKAPVVAQEHRAAGPRRVVGELAGGQRSAT